LEYVFLGIELYGLFHEDGKFETLEIIAVSEDYDSADLSLRSRLVEFPEEAAPSRLVGAVDDSHLGHGFLQQLAGGGTVSAKLVAKGKGLARFLVREDEGSDLFEVLGEKAHAKARAEILVLAKEYQFSSIEFFGSLAMLENLIYLASHEGILTGNGAIGEPVVGIGLGKANVVGDDAIGDGLKLE
tara:strand:- start:7 stop:564 length:558 start_codon:yes stop_codon:yes gene_type:complete